MGSIRDPAGGMVTNTRTGTTVPIRYEGPRDEHGRSPVGFLKASGKTYVHPMYAWAKQAGASDDNIRPAHRGADGHGTEFVSDQRWIYDLAEAAELERTEPGRFVRVDG